MFIRKPIFLILMLLNFSGNVSAKTEESVNQHGDMRFSTLTMELDYGSGKHDKISSWDIKGWTGGDYNKLYFISEGEAEGKNIKQAEFWVLYSRNIDIFWDSQFGIRYDTKPKSRTYLVAGFMGLAPYFFETEAHLFLNEDGIASARFKIENHFLITQKLITQPYLELNLSSDDSTKSGVASGITDTEIGLKTYYEITKKFAPYIDLRYERKLGANSSLAQKNNENNSDVIASIGLKVIF